MPSYTGSGGFSFQGCAVYTKQFNISATFQVGDIAYVCHKARRGCLEIIAIKSILLVQSGSGDFLLYKDTFNWLHNENDVCTQSEAMAFAAAYWLNQSILAEDLAITC